MIGVGPSRLLACAATCAALLAASLAAAQGQSAEQFYRGKTVTMIVPADPGGSYDLHTRLVSRHIGRHIPGRPNAIVQNMTGAGGLRAINYVYEEAPQDGTVLAIPIQENVSPAQKLIVDARNIPPAVLERARVLLGAQNR
jgi:tripartite-type tricarboxylate transporter receptor subunit TctC